MRRAERRGTLGDMSTLTGPEPEDMFRAAAWHQGTPVAVAAAMLGLSESMVRQLCDESTLSGGIVDGELHVHTGQLRELAHVALTDRAVLRVEAREVARRALELYLQERPAAPDWHSAHTEGRPLACSPRGPQDRARAWERHAVVVRVSAVLDNAMNRWDEFPEFHALPVAPTLGATLCELAGVKPAYHATPLDQIGGNHRLTGWLRLDQAHWQVRPDAAVTEWLARIEAYNRPATAAELEAAERGAAVALAAQAAAIRDHQIAEAGTRTGS